MLKDGYNYPSYKDWVEIFWSWKSKDSYYQRLGLHIVQYQTCTLNAIKLIRPSFKIKHYQVKWEDLKRYLNLEREKNTMFMNNNNVNCVFFSLC